MAEKKTFKDLPQEVRESAHRIWLAGLGALSTAEQEGSKLFQTLVSQGESYEAKGREAASDAKETVEEKVDQAKAEAAGLWGTVESRIDDAVTGSFRRFGVPTREEIATLTRRVEELTTQVERLATGAAAPAKKPAARKPAARKPAAKKTAGVTATAAKPAAKKTATRKTAAKKATTATKTAAKAPAATADAAAAKASSTAS